jgi:hypothetical protein
MCHLLGFASVFFERKSSQCANCRCMLGPRENHSFVKLLDGDSQTLLVGMNYFEL